jgi:hypothetical protein
VTKVWWEISENDIGATLTAYPNRARVYSSGECGGNGTVTVTAYARGNPEIFDQVEIEISGQTGPECSSIEMLQSEMVAVYPVPARERVMIQLPLDADFAVEVISLTGKSVHTAPGEQGACELDVTGLNPGIYLLNISVQGKRLTSRMVLYQ